MKKVLLLSQDYDNRSFLSIVRSLGKQNIVIHTTSSNEFSTPVKSRYIKKRIFISSSPNTRNHWRDEFIKLLKKENYTLVIPCDDLSDISLQANKEELSKHAQIYLLNSDTYDIVKNKHKTTQLALSLGIDVPKSILIEKNYILEDIKQQFSLPVVLKPISSFDENSLERHNVTIVHDYQSLKTELDLMFKTSPVQVQSFFDGVGVAVSLLAKAGGILVATQHKRLHEPFTGGGSSYRRSMPLNQDLVEASAKIIRHLNYTGVAMFEFRYNIDSNKWVLLEINGRFWGSLPLAISAGIDYPYLLYLVLTNNITALPNFSYNQNTFQRNLELDMYWFNEALFNSSNEELEHHGYTKKNLAIETLRLLSFRDSIDTFSFSDPYPFILEVVNITRQISYLIIKKTRLHLLQKNFIRRLIRKNLLLKLSKSKNILFVCKGNICRSPFAQQAAKHVWGNIPIINSTGYYKEINRSSPVIALNTASKLNIDLSSHRSSLINIEDIKAADIIFYFDEANREELYKKFAFYKHKMYALSLLSENAPTEIEDPIDQGEDGFLDTYTAIFNILKNAN